MDKQSGTKVVFALVLLGALKVAYAVIKQFIKITARVIVYFGLYVPFFYFIVGSVLVGLGFFRFEVLDINAILFYVGLGLCVACSVIITIKTYAVKPVASITAGAKDEISAARASTKPRTVQTEDPILFIYHSGDHPELLIEEHADKYVVYYDDGVNPIKLLRIEPKEQ